MENIAFLPIAPEIAVLAGAVIVLMSAVALGQDRKEWGTAGAIALLVAAALSVLQWLRLGSLESAREFAYSARGVTEAVLNPMVVMDRFSAVLGMAVYADRVPRTRGQLAAGGVAS